MDNTPPERPVKKLFRSKTDRVFAGICGGLGEYFNVDAILFRILFILLAFSGGAGVVLYIILALIVPNEDQKDSVLGHEKMESMAQEMGQRAQKLAQDMRDRNWFSDRKNIIGLIIVVFGLLVLFDQLSPIHWLRWGFIWPVLVVFLGVIILTSKRRNQ